MRRVLRLLPPPPLFRLCFGPVFPPPAALRRGFPPRPEGLGFGSPAVKRGSPKKSALIGCPRLSGVRLRLGRGGHSLFSARNRWAQKEKKQCTSIVLNS